jgi:hypothetical protein
MYRKTGSLLITCLLSIATYTSCVTILEKQIEIGTDPNTQKKLVAKAYCFAENNTDEQWWLSVFAYEKKLFFLVNIKNQKNVFPITQIISASSDVITIDPTTDNSNPDQKVALQPSGTSALITIKAKLSSHLQIFKEFSILLAKGNTKALAAFIDTHNPDTIKEIISHAILCQGQCYIQCKDSQKLDALLQAKQPLAEPISFTGGNYLYSRRNIFKRIFGRSRTTR